MKYLEFAQVVGQPKGGVWSQVVVRPASEAGVDNKVEIGVGGIVAIVTWIRESSEEEAQIAGHELISKLESKLEFAEDLFISVKDVVGGSDEIEILVMKIVNQEVELVGRGKGGVILARNERVGQVFEGEKGEWKVMKGMWQSGDRILLGSEGLLGEMSKMLLEDVLGMELSEAGDELVTRVQAAGENAGAAGLIVELFGSEGKLNEKKAVVSHKKAGIDHVEEEVEPKIYLKGELRGKKMAIGAGLIILLLLLGSVFLGFRKRESMAKEASYNQTKQEVETKISQATVLADDNPAKAKQLMIEAGQVIEVAMQSLGESEEYLIKLNELKRASDEAYKQVSGELSLGQAPVWFDLNLIKEGMFGQKMALNGGRVVVLDEGSNLLASIGLSTKKAELVGGGELMSGSSLVDILGKRGVVMADAGVVEVDVEKKTSAELVKKENDWKRIGGLSIFSGNVYLADVDAGEIWRYPAISSGVGERQRWFGVGVEPDLSGVTDMVVDGDIWTVDQGGEVDRYRRGSEMNYIVSGLDGEMGDVVAIDTNLDSDYIYVLDRQGKRVVILNKETGEYERQLLWEGLAAAEDMVAAEEEGKVLVLSGSSIYELPLQN